MCNILFCLFEMFQYVPISFLEYLYICTYTKVKNLCIFMYIETCWCLGGWLFLSFIAHTDSVQNGSSNMVPTVKLRWNSEHLFTMSNGTSMRICLFLGVAKMNRRVKLLECFLVWLDTNSMEFDQVGQLSPYQSSYLSQVDEHPNNMYSI